MSCSPRTCGWNNDRDVPASCCLETSALPAESYSDASMRISSRGWLKPFTTFPSTTEMLPSFSLLMLYCRTPRKAMFVTSSTGSCFWAAARSSPSRCRRGACRSKPTTCLRPPRRGATASAPSPISRPSSWAAWRGTGKRGSSPAPYGSPRASRRRKGGTRACTPNSAIWPPSGLRFGQIEFGTAIRACNDHRDSAIRHSSISAS